MPNKLSQFWQELKRRNVVRVITVYAGAAFVIIELINNISGPLRLPEWTPTLVIVLLAIGFPVAIIFSWFYDIHPEGGMVKTEPAHKVKAEDIPNSSNSWKIASYISFVVIVGLIILNVIPRTGKNEILEKSIAVLPLEYLSENPDKAYLADGVLDAITGHLSKLEGLRVMPRTSVEQYRENKKSAKEIGEELNVSYLIEGSFLMVDNQVKLTIQLVVAEEGDHIFFQEYDRDYKDIIAVQSEVAQTIAKEIEVAISPEEKKRIEKIPTTNQTAYDFYQRGREEFWKYQNDPYNLTALDKAESHFKKALQYDPSYGQAYLGLAQLYWEKNYIAEYLTEDFLDSALVLVNKALSFDIDLEEAYVLRGNYFQEKGYFNEAFKEYNKAIEINYNVWQAYFGRANLYLDMVTSIDDLHKALSLGKGRERPDLLEQFCWATMNAGFLEIGQKYNQERLRITNDSSVYYSLLARSWFWQSNLDEALKYYREAYMLDSMNIEVLFMVGILNGYVGKYEKSLDFLEKWIDKLDKTLVTQFRYNGMHRVGYAYWKNNKFDEANYYFDLQMKYCNKQINDNLLSARYYLSYYDRAGVNAFRGETEKAYDDLRVYNQQAIGVLAMINLIKIDPLFNSIRNEPEFQRIQQSMEAKYNAEHERVRQWLEENDML